MSIHDNLGDAMGDAVYGAGLGQALGRSRDNANDASQNAHAWRAYGLQKQAQANDLEIKVMMEEKHVEHLETDLQTLTGKTKTLGETALALEQRYPNIARANWSLDKARDLNVQYGKKARYRLEQMQKALQHSSADVVSIKAFHEPYKLLVEKMELANALPADMEKKAEEIWDKFMSGDKLTDSREIMEIIEKSNFSDKTPLSYQLID